MTFERIMVILFTKVAQTVIAERFTHTFFDNDGNRVRKIFAYLFSVFIAIFVNLFFYKPIFATVYKGNIIKNLIMDCQSYTKYRPNETTGGIFVSWRRKEELPTGA
jgi:hypothetical protein